MASPNIGYTNPQASPSRMPKLSYRTHSVRTMSVSSASTAFTNSTSSPASTTPTSPLYSDFCPSPRSPPADMSLPASPGQSSFASASKRSFTLPKKRSNFFSDLFSVKEPSAQALQDYQRQLMKQGGGRVTPVGMPGVSSAKLPATVPKVNSKWDGVPQTTKAKEKSYDTKRQSMLGSSRQLSTSTSAGSDYSASSMPNSSSKRLSRDALDGASMQTSGHNNLAELYGWETSASHSGSSTINFSTVHRPTASQSTVSRRQSSSSSPTYPPRPPAIQFPPIEPSLPVCTDASNPPSLTNSPVLTPYESSPATPDVSLPSLSLAASPKLAESPLAKTKTTLLEIPGAAEEVIVKSAGVNILGPPVAAKRKPKPIILPNGDERSKTSGAGFPSSSILRREPPSSEQTPSPRPPPSSYFPHAIGTPSPDSPAKLPARLGSKHERQAIAPWLSPERPAHVKASGEGIITPTSEGGKSLRKKGPMTLFKK